jgi:hypothetical protein
MHIVSSMASVGSEKACNGEKHVHAIEEPREPNSEMLSNSFWALVYVSRLVLMIAICVLSFYRRRTPW